MCPVYPWLPLTVREVPLNEELPDRPNDELFEPDRELLIEALDPKCEPEVEEPPKCEPSMFDTPRLGEIELRDADDELSIEPRPAVADPLLKFPAREFDATEGEFDPRDPPAALDELPANERAVDPPALELPLACVPAVFPVLGPRALPVLPANECQLPSAFARVAPRPAGQPDERAFKEFERPALEPAPPFRPFAEFPPERPAFIPFEREPPYMLPPRPYEPILRAELPGDPPPRYMPPPPPRYAPPPPP
jgi:hypothetical protein